MASMAIMARKTWHNRSKLKSIESNNGETQHINKNSVWRKHEIMAASWHGEISGMWRRRVIEGGNRQRKHESSINKRQNQQQKEKQAASWRKNINHVWRKWRQQKSCIIAKS